ncbi:MAG: hypothetical protein A3C44_03930 [Gammaproteobacteria bacterium RIFCSPHIGHO2_02_FULL_39_13]|nr:MAG: hypothetical protein A3C44_03930 [Gammaproteobacteria bacterium RIFCSPHIGHO2_02_FULL_39_13]OGT50286.1 MAG: hypothetical protein A3E53_00855 [Gammaproteobacteria bacterium RIFCSPHIGHO2_12_FULL_39_24]
MSKKYSFTEMVCPFISLCLSVLFTGGSVYLAKNDLKPKNLGIGNSTNLDSLPVYYCADSVTEVCGFGCMTFSTPTGNANFMAIFSELSVSALNNACVALSKFCDKGNTHTLYHFYANTVFNNKNGLESFTGNCEVDGTIITCSVGLALFAALLLLVTMLTTYYLIQKCMKKNDGQPADNSQNSLLENPAESNTDRHILSRCLSGLINRLCHRKSEPLLNQNGENYCSI